MEQTIFFLFLLVCILIASVFILFCRLDCAKLDIKFLKEVREIDAKAYQESLKILSETIDSHAAAINRLEELLFHSNSSQEENKTDDVIPLEFHNYHSKHA